MKRGKGKILALGVRIEISEGEPFRGLCIASTMVVHRLTQPDLDFDLLRSPGFLPLEVQGSVFC